MIKDVFHSISEKMILDFQISTKLINHNGEKGTDRENALVKYLRPHIPDQYQRLLQNRNGGKIWMIITKKQVNSEILPWIY